MPQGMLGFRFFRLIEAPKDAGRHNYFRQLFVLVFLRLMEPFLIFYFVMELIVLILFKETISSPLLLIGSALLVSALVREQTFSEIVDAVESTISSRE